MATERFARAFRETRVHMLRKIVGFVGYTSLMHKTMGMPILASAFLALAFIGLPFATNAVDGLPCNNPHTATAADIAAGYPAGSQVCPSDYQQSEVTPQSGEAKTFLRSVLCTPDGDNYGGKGPDGTILGLDPKFSICAAKFLEAARGSGINVCIREGARSVEKQNEYVRRGVIACKKGAMCEHPRGVAIDVNVFPNPTSCTSYRQLHNSAASFGVTFYLGCKDAFHFVPKKGSDCSGGGVIQPDTFYDYPQYYEQSSPLSSLTDMIRQALGMQTQASAPSSAPAAAPPQSAPAAATYPKTAENGGNICTPHFTCSGAVMYYQTSSCTTQTYQLCENGCDGNSCALGPSQLPASPVSSLINPTPIKATSTIDLINALANPKPSSPTGTGAPLILVVRGQDAAMLQGGGQTQSSSTGFSNTYQLAPTSGQTFTSGDLSQNPPSAYSSQQISTFQATLENFKNILLHALEYLKPFGGKAAPNQEIWK